MSFTCPHCGQTGSCWSQVGRPIQVVNIINESDFTVTSRLPGIADLAKGHRRYEYIRKLNVRQFKELYTKSLTSILGFDALVDEAIDAAENIV